MEMKEKMEMKENSSKTDYILPCVKVVSFHVEGGFGDSDEDKAYTDDIVQGDAYEGEGYFNYSF